MRKVSVLFFLLMLLSSHTFSSGKAVDESHAIKEGVERVGNIIYGDFYKELPITAYTNRVVVPDTIIIHTDDQSGNYPENWNTTTTWNGLANREDGGKSVHFGVGLDGVTQFPDMFQNGVIQCKGAGELYNRHTIQIEMGGRNYNHLITGEASPEMEKSIKIITERTTDLVVILMKDYNIQIGNVIGHYQIEGSGKTDPGDLYFVQYFLPMLIEKLIEGAPQKMASSGHNPLLLDYRTTISLRAAKNSVSQMMGPYSWEEGRYCSSFVATYMKNLGIPKKESFPWSNVVEQVSWAKENFPQYTYDAKLEDFLNGNLWEIIKPSDVVYLQTPIGHNGYNTYYHTAILIGYRENGVPIFSEIAAGMKNPSAWRTLQEMTSFYSYMGTKPYGTGVKTPDNLTVTWFDPLAIINSLKNTSFGNMLYIAR